MESCFTADFFTGNRAALRQSVAGNIPIVITANGQMQRAGDEPYKFVQDSNFWYLTGLTVPELILVITANDTFLIAPSLSFERQVFDGAHDEQGFSRRSGITTVLDEQTGWQRLRAEIGQYHSVATLGTPPSYLTRHRLYSLPFRRRLLAKLKRLDKQLQITDVRSALAARRCIKQPVELQALQRAIDITCETLHDTVQGNQFQEAKYEYELEAALTYGFRSRGADGHAFEPIVGAGPHSTTLHHVNNTGHMEPADLIVLDVGASVEHYAADITRTVSRQPMTDRQREVFEAVENVQDYALAQLKPGVYLQEYEHKVAERMGEELMKLGLIQTATAEAIRHYFPHATSHFLGLDTHDVGNYLEPLAENMVVTCEPGIYIPGEGIGVRTEDDVLITAKGAKVLSDACPRLLSTVQ